jgi:hypothetical protein
VGLQALVAVLVLEGFFSESARGIELLVGFIGEGIWIAVMLPFVAKYLALSKISDSTRSLIKAHFASPLTLEALRYFSGVPPVWSFALDLTVLPPPSHPESVTKR